MKDSNLYENTKEKDLKRYIEEVYKKAETMEIEKIDFEALVKKYGASN